MKLIIVTGNHNSLVGIQDHIDIISGLFGDVFSIETRPLPIRGEHNLIIEEFSNPKFRKLLENLHLDPQTKLHLLMTEIPDREAGGAVLLNGHIVNHIGIPLSWKIFFKIKPALKTTYFSLQRVLRAFSRFFPKLGFGLSQKFKRLTKSLVPNIVFEVIELTKRSQSTNVNCIKRALQTCI